MSNAAVQLDKDTPFDIKWFGREELVFACLSRMIADGWLPSNTYSGVVHKKLVARPVKIEGSKVFTGVGLWEI